MTSVSPTAGDLARRYRAPAMLVLAIVAAGIVIALLQPTAAGYLDPGSTAADGGHALADLLAGRGQQVVAAGSASAAASHANTGDDTILITSPDLLNGTDLARLGKAQANLVLVGPDPTSLSALAPQVRQGGQVPAIVAQPRCNAQPAVLAGDADVGGTLLETTDPAAVTCYPSLGGWSLIQYNDGGRTISVLGTGTPLTNGNLGDHGNAALALNLLRGTQRIVWLTPNPAAAPATTASPGGQRSLFSLLPLPVYLVTIQLCVAVLLAAAWRGHRLGPVVAERLPVVVRASETVEGHGRLYQARRTRGRAAEALRDATRRRLARLTGLPEPPPPAHPHGEPDGQADARTALAAAVAARTGRDPVAVATLLHGPPPDSDAALVSLANDLDTLERKVRQP